MNGVVEVPVLRDLFDAWDAELAESVRRVALTGAAKAGGRLLAGDPEFVVADDSDIVRVQYRMMK